jgi:hypothetical protein
MSRNLQLVVGSLLADQGTVADVQSWLKMSWPSDCMAQSDSESDSAAVELQSALGALPHELQNVPVMLSLWFVRKLMRLAEANQTAALLEGLHVILDEIDVQVEERAYLFKYRLLTNHSRCVCVCV